jgi:hypothetical protein
VQRQNALNTLIQQGKARNLAERGSVDAFPGAPIVSNDTGSDDEEEFDFQLLEQKQYFAAY